MLQVSDVKGNNGHTVSLPSYEGECVLGLRKNNENDLRVFYINIMAL